MFTTVEKSCLGEWVYYEKQVQLCGPRCGWGSDRGWMPFPPLKETPYFWPAGETESCLGQIEATGQEVMRPLATFQRWPMSSNWLIQECDSLTSLLRGQFAWLALSLQIQWRPDFSKTTSCSAFSCSTFSLVSFSWKCFLNKSLNQIPITELMRFPSSSFTGTRVQCNTKTPVMYAICENLPCKRLAYAFWISWWIHL